MLLCGFDVPIGYLSLASYARWCLCLLNRQFYFADWESHCSVSTLLFSLVVFIGALGFGMLVSAIACFHGMNVETVVKAVTHSMIAVLICNLLLSAPRYIG